LSEELWISDKIIWYWISTWKEKYSLLKASDVFLFTSRAEWFPMTILEALWCWLPVFISQWCNLPEVDGIVGKVVSNWDDQNIELLLKLINGKSNHKKKIGDYLINYSIFNIVNSLVQNYEI
jgi:glycosyltransferase involved in cell wall biosynthesis